MTHKAHATEILLAVPQSETDIYALHQRVWSCVDRALLVEKRPTILYRRESGMVRVRITGTAVKEGMGMPAAIELKQGSLIDWRVHLGLWRSEALAPNVSPSERVRDLMARAGIRVETCTYGHWIAQGRKRQHDIRIPTAEARVMGVVEDPRRAVQAWSEGLGRGRRFGLGMITAS